MNAIGLDVGTTSVRAVVVSCEDGSELASSVVSFMRGVVLDPAQPERARQDPLDVRDCVERALSDLIAQGTALPESIAGLGIATTASSPLPVGSDGSPLAARADFVGDLDAMCWLWKDHTSHAEAVEITQKAEPRMLARVGGSYSSEWFWSKILRCARVNPAVFSEAETWIELQDYLPAALCGVAPKSAPRGRCAAGHKALFSEEWGGLPSANVIGPELAELRGRLYDQVFASDHPAGGIAGDVAARTGLRPGTPVAVGTIDAHAGAVGVGVREGVLVKILGTSSCDITVLGGDAPNVDGLSGIVSGSVLPGLWGLEAGQAAYGDLFAWAAETLAGDLGHATLESMASALAPGASGLLALDWNNGNRCVLGNPRLSGLLVGQSLSTTMPEVYRALVEAAAFGSRMILDRISDAGCSIEEVIVCGGIAERSPFVVQTLADILGRRIVTSSSAQSCALGAAMFGATVGGVFDDVSQAQEAMRGPLGVTCVPNASARAVYDRLFALYRSLHAAFGTSSTHEPLCDVMPELLALRDQARGR